MTIFSEELLLAKQAYDVYYIEEAKEHIEKALALEPDNIEALEINCWIAFHSDVIKAKYLTDIYLAKKQNLSVENDLTSPQLLACTRTELKPQFSLLLASRYLGNMQNQFKAFLQSLLKHTKDITNLEIILRIDLDDDSDFFKTQLNQLPKNIQWKLLAGSRGKGFLDRTVYLWQAMEFVHPETKYVLPLSDNAVFVTQNWDSILISILQTTHTKVLNLTESKNFVFNNANEFIWLLYSCNLQPCYYVMEHSLALEIKKWFTSEKTFNSNGFNLDLILNTLTTLMYPEPNPFFQQLIRSERGTGIEVISPRDKQLCCMLDYFDLVEGQLYQKCFAYAQAQDFSLSKALHLGKKMLFNISGKIKRHFHKTVQTTPENYFLKADASFREGDLFQAIKQYHTGLDLYLKNKITDTGEKAILAKPVIQSDRSALISLMLGCRIKNNSNSKLPDFLASIIKTAHDIRNIEVMIAFDHDDDFKKIDTILSGIKNLNVIPVTMPRQRGYYDLHHKYSTLYNYISPTSRAIMICSDDSFFNKLHWDQTMVSMMQRYPDNLVFYNLFMQRDEIPLVNENTFMWWLFQRGPATLYPAFGRGVIEAIKNALPADPDWSYFGPSLMVDSFFEMLRWHLFQASRLNRVVNIPDAIKRVVDSAAHPDSAEKLAMRYRDGLLLYADKLSDKSNIQLKAIAKEMVKKLVSA